MHIQDETNNKLIIQFAVSHRALMLFNHHRISPTWLVDHSYITSGVHSN